MKKYIFLIFTASLFICCQNVTDKSTGNQHPFTKNNKSMLVEENKKKKITIDAFTELPKDIDESGGCFFSLSKDDMENNRYICVNNFANIAYVSINNTVNKFILKNYNETNKTYSYSNDSLNLTIKVNKKTSLGDETTQMEGVIVIENGESKVEQKFIGICGL